MRLRFYYTLGCHLCELAEAMLLAEQTRFQLAIDAVDIGDSDALIERYGVRIPVVQRLDNGSELAWPFDVAGLRAFFVSDPQASGMPA